MNATGCNELGFPPLLSPLFLPSSPSLRRNFPFWCSVPFSRTSLLALTRSVARCEPTHRRSHEFRTVQRTYLDPSRNVYVSAESASTFELRLIIPWYVIFFNSLFRHLFITSHEYKIWFEINLVLTFVEEYVKYVFQLRNIKWLGLFYIIGNHESIKIFWFQFELNFVFKILFY